MKSCCNGTEAALCVLAVIFSPLAVLIKYGCTREVLICFLLFLLLVIPGIIYAWYCILSGRHFRRLVLTILCIILSPLAMLIKVGCTKHFFINILLFILIILPGIIHGLWVIWFLRRAKGLLD